VPLQQPRIAVDPGCGPGNSTELLIDRFPDAGVIGLDSSKDMLRQARERLPHCTFIEADLETWTPQENVELLLRERSFPAWTTSYGKCIWREEAFGDPKNGS
jgi:trans-aconitate 2-methyltransferase